MNETTTTGNGELIYTIDEKVENSIKFNHKAERVSDALGINPNIVDKYQNKGADLLKAILSNDADCPSRIIENIYNIFQNESEIGKSIMVERVVKCIVEGFMKDRLFKSPKAEA